MSYANRFPSTQHTRYRSSWGPSSVSVFNRADVPRPSPEEEEFADFYHERLHSAQSRQLIPLQEDLADWINKTITSDENLKQRSPLEVSLLTVDLDLTFSRLKTLELSTIRTEVPK
ncbi:hypothetical protein EAI_05316 [Harpegnathos saltator]|uniref:Uncharacterized protein n=1 Tax=Harpegnathos saltator TaxID=610380 RepID=E2BL49_HARSA|nr:hypothetical protein EAI_05316 [Harpegnathos saltator]